MKFKKIGIVLVIAIAIIAGAVYYIYSTKEKPCATCGKNSKNQKNDDMKFSEYLIYETDLCKIITKETVTNLLGKPIIKTTPITTSTMHGCKYYLTDTHAITINHDTLSVANQKTGHESLDRSIITNPKITMEHFLVVQENKLINEIYLVLGENEYVSINRTSGKTLSEDEMVTFAENLAQIVSGIVPLTTSNNSDQQPSTMVPLPQEEDIVSNFFSLIAEKKPSEAVSAMSETITNDESMKQAWAVQFNAISSMKVVNIEPSTIEEWSAERHKYKLTLDVKINADSANAPIPYYGWDNGLNTRWVTIVKENGLWKILEIGTGQ